MRLGYVYLIGPTEGPIKIGHAVNVKTRLSHIQTGNWQEVGILHTASVPWLIAPRVEADLHEQFAERRVRGEWFDVPLDVLKPALDGLATAYSLGRHNSDDFSERQCFALCKDPHASVAAVARYRNLANDPTKTKTAQMINSILRQSVGEASYAMFLTVVIHGIDLGGGKFRNNAGLARQAEASLIKALDMLPRVLTEMTSLRHRKEREQDERRCA